MLLEGCTYNLMSKLDKGRVLILAMESLLGARQTRFMGSEGKIFDRFTK